MKRYVIIVAGGKGSRMQSTIPKQFMEVAGKPVLIHTITNFKEAEPEASIILVLPADQLARWERICEKFSFEIAHKVTTGGRTRFDSVKNGLNEIEGNGIVAIHDSVRPFASAKTIRSAFKAAEMYGTAVPAIPINDSIRQIDSARSIAVDRSKFCIIQTPQCFDIALLKGAYKKEHELHFTDDATVVESNGIRIHLIDGNPENIKITRPLDIALAEALLTYQPFSR